DYYCYSTESNSNHYIF
nr:immunoglobulin light chain junction region [Macaca mulatta]